MATTVLDKKTSLKGVIKQKGAQTYIEAVGRRKSAVARVRVFESENTSVVINDRPLNGYFATAALRETVLSPLHREGMVGKYGVTVVVKGGGTTAQAEAIRHGLSRAIIKDDINQKGDLKKLGFLRRDAREVERKHFGLKKARKASQWKKR